MSREDVCACPGCYKTRGEHPYMAGADDRWHHFVEPARTEAPQGETDQAVCIAYGLKECEPCVKAGTWTFPYTPPAAQPETGGDEARVREIARAEAESIATRWVTAHMTARQGMVDDITASLVRYRALGRDDIRAAVEEERDDWLGEGNGDLTHWDVLNRLCDAIAARRGSGR